MTLAPRTRAALVGLLAATCALTPVAADAAPRPSAFDLTPLGTYATGQWDQAASEIVAFDKATKRLFVVNAHAGTVDVVDARRPGTLRKVATLDTPGANSVAVSRGLIAVAEQGTPKTAPGTVSFFDARTLEEVRTVTVGALPDMVTFTPNGRTLLVANEGEPTGYGAETDVDPEGSVSIIDLTRGARRASVRTAGFTAFNAQRDALVASGVRLNGPGATVAQDVEPEYIAVDKSGKTAWVTLQEANAVAIVDIRRARVTDIVPLGLKDHSVEGSGLDASDRDGAINIATWPVKGLYMPDAIATFDARGKTYIVTANEGDAREWGDEDSDTFFLDESRIKDLALDPTAFPNAKALQKNEALGRLNAAIDSPHQLDADGNPVYTELWTYGGRSITIRDAQGNLVWDSGDTLERLVGQHEPEAFNAETAEDGNQTDDFDGRSDNKGPEPEGVTTGKIRGRTYAFVGLERTSAIAVFDVTVPTAPAVKGYFTNEGDVAPEGLLFIPASDSPTRTPLLVVGNEVSGTTTVWEIDA